MFKTLTLHSQMTTAICFLVIKLYNLCVHWLSASLCVVSNNVERSGNDTCSRFKYIQPIPASSLNLKIWSLHNLVEASFDLFRYLLLSEILHMNVIGRIFPPNAIRLNYLKCQEIWNSAESQG